MRQHPERRRTFGKGRRLFLLHLCPVFIALLGLCTPVTAQKFGVRSDGKDCWAHPDAPPKIEPRWDGNTFIIEATNVVRRRMYVRICLEVNSVGSGQYFCPLKGGIKPGETKVLRGVTIGAPTGRYSMKWVGSRAPSTDQMCTRRLQSWKNKQPYPDFPGGTNYTDGWVGGHTGWKKKPEPEPKPESELASIPEPAPEPTPAPRFELKLVPEEAPSPARVEEQEKKPEPEHAESKTCWLMPEECVDINPFWRAGTFIVALTNNCPRRLYTEICLDVTNYTDYLGNPLYCSLDVVWPEEQTGAAALSPYNPTGEYAVRWVGSQDEGTDRECRKLVEGWVHE